MEETDVAIVILKCLEEVPLLVSEGMRLYYPIGTSVSLDTNRNCPFC
ncbi:MAG TPA: hypothetical protein VFD73_01345 [Gemmatimonadales bacterium]|nr:hypothetical protein [Gemmatimonadales bacterium]